MAIYPILFKYLNLGGRRRRIMDVNLLVVRQPIDGRGRHSFVFNPAHY